MSKLASEYVANILNDWYIAIKQQDVETAEKYFEEIKPLFDEMEEDQEVLMYYSLLEERHKMLLYQTKGQQLPSHSYFTKRHAREIEKTDDMIEYYFYLFEALYESYNRNFESAISLFNIAEKKLSLIPDEIEIAEFYSKVASMYMMLGQNIVSLNYVTNAMNIYKNNVNYLKQFATSMMVVAHNYTELGQYEKSEEHYLQAIKVAKKLDDSFFVAMIHHNLSITYSEANRSQDCLNALKYALRNKEWCESSYYINSLYMIAKELLGMGEINKASYYLKKGQENLNQKQNKLYEAKINIIYELLQSPTSEGVDRIQSHMHSLAEKNDFDSIRDLALIVSRKFEEEGLYQEALKFSNKAILAEKKMKQLEGI
ncbi:Rap family tetratricopeptide repeat protein [Bacillus atrophaeus]|uniref:Rap family tetratricopeptide repeat protein n=1 Tax=Bacillus atrophaeus TaxID=1452 RepID=UPI002E1A9045|nr:tetratricopeptide repeat protein [Bacillus atrophaeus]